MGAAHSFVLLERGRRLQGRSVEAITTELADSLAAQLQLEIVDVEYVKEGPQWYLRVYIDKPGGVTLEDCTLFNQVLSAKLDEEDPIPSSYLLEVSSPGIYRPLKKDSDFQRFSGELIEVKTYAPVDGRKKWRGKLLGYKDGFIELEVEERLVRIPRDKVAKAALSPEF